ncbi:cystatin [Callorhinchus milii]|uniref:Cystatin-like n=1 Tax=Callorhinchus milii TaxID=7868 RepID=A0A4W3K045_CALMI|nr:cystatin [Callorhinchus milii]|eukprot:gi/632960989/ref/XP_007896509.1/ PREDICTED: cystatin-like [Callorhinchus milii]
MAAVMEKLLLLAVLIGVSAASGSLLGGIEEAPVDDQVIQDAAQFALSEYNKASNDLYVSKISRIVSAKIQLVSGILYFLDVELGRTQCRRAVVDSLELCSFHTASGLARKERCRFTIRTIPWLQVTQLLKSQCQEVTT